MLKFINYIVIFLLCSIRLLARGLCKILQLKDVGLPGEVEQASGHLQAHEVVSQVEVGDILAVEQVFWHRFQAVAGQIHHANCLRHHLHKHTPTPPHTHARTHKHTFTHLVMKRTFKCLEWILLLSVQAEQITNNVKSSW